MIPTKAFRSCSESSSGGGAFAGTLRVAIALSLSLSQTEDTVMYICVTPNDDVFIKLKILALLQEKDCKKEKKVITILVLD